MTEPYAPEPLYGSAPAEPAVPLVDARPVAPDLPDEPPLPVAPDIPAAHPAPAPPMAPAPPVPHAAQVPHAARVPPAPPHGPVDGAALGAELSTAVILFHEAIGHRLGLSAADQRALGIIGGRGPMTAGTLAQLTGLSPGAVTGLVDRLERGGHVTRSADPGDRRRIVITAVPSPAPGVGEAFARLSAAMNALVGRYDAKESAAILDYLQRTIAILRDQTRLLSD
ncbi:MarR family winged helix-turn-helix transcriptional regulator [Virgisporangium ochraceum]|uniref:HTH marR-type domain-containing protein n=1 Tax=Virgisporangium ochraceum TaxID=65505 RepID=A0A8J4EDX3_9ACTN|nr:MarR family transcriptional regulator [Virgisporangium ochraceum]GIJ72010.1 hypothetical protein Voc01_069270 [Virgisporangium ochraceum]